jgi:hypothetical protein
MSMGNEDQYVLSWANNFIESSPVVSIWLSLVLGEPPINLLPNEQNAALVRLFDS